MMRKIFLQVASLVTAGLIFSCGNNADKATTLEDSSATDTSSVNPLAPVQKDNGLYSFTLGNLYFEADATNAGRVSTFSLEGKNILTGKEVNATNWGTSLWPSPQSIWGWPPSKQLDVNAYEASVQEDLSLTLTSQKDSLLGIVFAKNYKLNPSDTSVVITYTITNQSEKSLSLAPWEISRVAPGGLTFYPKGNTKAQGLLTNLFVEKDGLVWFDYDSSKINYKPSDVPKLLQDGAEGWMAQVSGDLLFIKKFKDVPADKAAPGEGEMEFYVNPDKSYIEIEQQGEYAPLATSQSVTWEVKWYLRKIPSSIKAETGNKALVEFVRAIVK